MLTITTKYLEDHLVFVVRTDEGIVGFYALQLDRTISRPADVLGANRAVAEREHPLELESEPAMLDHLWVLPDVIRSGIGRELFEHAEKIARTNGVTRLVIESDPHAEGFYQRMGAKTIGHTGSAIAGVSRQLPRMEKALR